MIPTIIINFCNWSHKSVCDIVKQNNLVLVNIFTFKLVVLKFVGDIELNKCQAGMHRTLSYNQERIQKVLVGDAVLNYCRLN